MQTVCEMLVLYSDAEWRVQVLEIERALPSSVARQRGMHSFGQPRHTSCLRSDLRVLRTSLTVCLIWVPCEYVCKRVFEENQESTSHFFPNVPSVSTT